MFRIGMCGDLIVAARGWYCCVGYAPCVRNFVHCLLVALLLQCSVDYAELV